jgi:hypothetical protein
MITSFIETLIAFNAKSRDYKRMNTSSDKSIEKINTSFAKWLTFTKFSINLQNVFKLFLQKIQFK